jgi:DNA polymerase-3 subunit beta
VYETELRGDINEKRTFLLPRKAVVELGRLVGLSEDKVSVDVTSNLARFKIGKTIFTSKLIDGKFPDYERVIPKNCDKTAVIEKDAFKNALIRASILSSDKYKGIRITVGDDILRLQAHNPEQEEAEEEMQIQYGNPPLTIGFNVGYLLDILNTVNDESVLMDFADTNSSSIVRIPGNNSALYVVMPMRL